MVGSISAGASVSESVRPSVIEGTFEFSIVAFNSSKVH
jgi:hypothetical protein